MDVDLLAIERKDRAEVKKLISLLAHDLKSPVHNVIGFASLLEEIILNGTSSEMRSYIEIIRKEAESVLKLVNEFSECCKDLHPDYSPEEKSKFNDILHKSKLERQNSIVSV